MQQPHLAHARRFAVSLAALLIALTAGPGGTTAPAQQDLKKYRLRDVYAAGDASEYEGSSDFNARVNVTLGERESLETVDFFRRQRRKYHETILAVDRQGWPTAIRRIYSSARRAENDINNQLHQEASPLQGKTVLVRLDAGGKVTVEGENLSAASRKEMADSLGAMRVPFFPERPVAIGEEWTAKSTELAHEFEGAESTTLTGVLHEIVMFEGRRCARVGISMEMGGKLVTDPASAKMKLAGDLYHALDLQRTVSARLIGPVEITGRVPVRNTFLDLRGDGSVETQHTFRWTKVAGMAVAARPAPAKRR